MTQEEKEALRVLRSVDVVKADECDRLGAQFSLWLFIFIPDDYKSDHFDVDEVATAIETLSQSEKPQDG